MQLAQVTPTCILASVWILSLRLNVESDRGSSFRRCCGSWMSWSPRRRESECSHAAFLIANAYSFIHFPEEDLAVANFAGRGSLDDGVDHGIDEFIFQYEFQLYFGQEISFVLPASIGLGVSFLPSVAAHF